ncbi:MAG: 4-phosphopantoate--beta-alanine ligase [Methanoculleaceae archaeon]
MIPPDHPRFKSLKTRERLADALRRGIIVPEGLAAHGRGEAFDYLMGERTMECARRAARIAAAMLRTAERPVISVNGNTAALAPDEIARLQQVSGAAVEVNLFHRTDDRIRIITEHLMDHGVDVLTGRPDRLLPLSHGRAFCLPHGIGAADVVLVPLEDGDRCMALRNSGKTVITVDLNPLSRTARTAHLTIVDELTRALRNITGECRTLRDEECSQIISSFDNKALLRAAIEEIQEGLSHALD